MDNLVEVSAAPSFVMARNGDLTEVNAAFAELLGYERSDLIGRPLPAINDGRDASGAAELFDGAREHHCLERRLVRKTGEVVWTRVYLSALADQQSHAITHVSGLVVELDQQKRSEAEIIATLSRLNPVLEAAEQGMWDSDERNNRVQYSRVWKTMRGFAPATVVESAREAWLERVHPDDRERVLDAASRLSAGELAYNTMEYRERHVDGHYIWILSRGRPIEWFPDGKPSRIVGTDTDITSLKETEERLRFVNTLLTTTMETSPDAILVVDAGGRIVSFNGRFVAMWHIPAELLEAREDDPVLFAVASAMKDPEAFVARVRHLYEHPEEEGRDVLETTDGRLIDRVSGALRSAQGEHLGRVWFFRDNTEKIRQAEQLQLQNFRFGAALDNMAQGLCMFDGNRRLVVSNSRYAEIYRLSPQDLRPGIGLLDLLRMELKSGERNLDMSVARHLSIVDAGKAAAFVVELADGRAIAVRHQPLMDGGWVATHEDITEQRQSQARIDHLARHDALTDLPNRALFREHMVEVSRRIAGGEMVGVLCVDLDGFKRVNDTFGHSVGDGVLEQVGARLQAAARRSEMIARLGGDEFVIIQPLHEGLNEVAEIARRVVHSLGQPFEIGQHHVLIGASVGIAVAPADGRDGETLARNADLALYRAKHQGRGNFYFYEKGLDFAAQERLALETGLRSALSQRELRLVFQPLLNLRDNRICSFEALLRWPDRGNLAPEQFIAIAEESGLIMPIGQWVLAEACAAAATWPDEIGVSVNLSPVQFRHNRSLVDHVRTALSSAGIRPERLELEITESVFLRDSEDALHTLLKLKELGVRIAVDDFGTGYSSLSYLRRFPFDKIKIDQSFVRDSTASEDSLAIIKALIGLGRSLGMTTTAEGVETEAQLTMIRNEGCTEVQGFLFSAPLPANSVAAMISKFGPRKAPERRRRRRA